MTKLSETLQQQGVTLTQRSTVGNALLRALPNVKHENVKKHFGSSFAAERNKKYSKSQHVFEIDGQLFTLYMSYGVWRFGAFNNPRPESAAVLKYIERLLNK